MNFLFNRENKMKKRFFIFAAILCAVQLYAASYGMVNVLDFKEHVISPGTEKEDWQPAIQMAVQKAYAGNRCLYFPAGTYNIMKAVDFANEPSKIYNSGLTVRGDGRFASIIKQNNPKENCVNWTGKTYKGSIQSGTVSNMSILGGDISLNIKWHNNFTLTSCYMGSSRIGLHSEGWSNRFNDIIIRHCKEIGFSATAHFNDCTIRDGYFSRCAIAIMLNGGTRGVRISGIGIEHAVKCAIYVRNSMAIAITECYFEGNAMKPVEGWAENGSIVLDYKNQGITVDNCIFRGTANNSGHIVVGSGRNIKISNNVNQVHLIGADALVMFAPPSSPNQDAGIHAMTVENNNICYGGRIKHTTPIDYIYFERIDGLMEKALKNGCVLEGGVKYLRTVTNKAAATKSDATDFQ